MCKGGIGIGIEIEVRGGSLSVCMMAITLLPRPSFSFTFVFSLSFVIIGGGCSGPETKPYHHRQFLIRRFRPRTTATATASDLISLLGTPQQASSVNVHEARQLQSCFKFIVPFSPNQSRSGPGKRDEENQLVWRPPEAVMELARIAVDSGGDPAAIQRTLDPTIIPVPDIEGSKKTRCELTRTPYGRHFTSEDLNSYLEFLFKLIAVRGPDVGLNVSLDRFDFFHGHIFLASDSGRLGILFHAKEYPAFDKVTFPYNMGFCQIGSNVKYDQSMNLRNILWLAPLPSSSDKAWEAPGVLVVLDARSDGIIYKDLIPGYAHYVRTLYEEDFGDVVADINYLNSGGAKPDYKIYIC